jgi:hypothetical protein
MQIKICLLLISTFLSIVGFCQKKSISYTGIIINQETNRPISNVNVQIIETKKGTRSNINGEFKFTAINIGALISFSFVGFKNKELIVVENIEESNIIYLSPKTEILEEFTISSKNVETMPTKYKVFDYAFYNDNILLIITASKLALARLLLLSEDLDTLAQTTLPEKPKEFFKDCFNNNHVICTNNTYQINISKNKLNLIYPTKNIELNKLVRPCVGNDSLSLYFAEKSGEQIVNLNRLKFKTRNDVLHYYHINKINKDTKSLVTLINEETIKTRVSMKENIRKKIRDRFYRTPIEAEFDRYFAEKIVSKEIFSPFFMINDTIYIMDYINSKIRKYKYGKPLEEIAFSFHNNKTLKREICFDQKTNKIYAIFKKSSFTELKEINLKNGRTSSNTIKIPFAYAEKIKVNNSYLYFLHKTLEESMTKKLSRIRIN